MSPQDNSVKAVPYIVPMPMPMPAIYNGDMRRPKLSIIELVICNIGAMLASIAIDFDVQLSNLSPASPRLQQTKLAPHICEDEFMMWRQTAGDAAFNKHSGYLGIEYEFSSSGGYAHNTYHGPTKHYRPLLSSMSGSPAAPAPLERPLRFTDCPQQLARRGCQSPGRAVAADYAQLFKAPTPSPRRKSSLGGSHEETACYAAAGPHASLRLPPPPPPPPPPDSSSERGPSERGPEALEPAPVCERPARGWPGFSHRRTPSNVSSASASSQSNVNPSFRLEDESECSPPPPPPPLYAPLGRQQQVCLRGYANASLAMDDEPPAAGLGAPLDRPTWLEMAGGCRLRSSLRRAGRCCGGPAGAASAGPGSGSPGEPTPPGSLAGEDAAHAAPRDGLPPARTRFSPLSYAAEHELLARQPAEGWARRGPPHAPQPQRRPSSDLELEREFFS